MASAEALVLHQFPPAFGLPVSESPPCAKVELYFRLTETPYRLGPGDTRKSPNKMVPYVTWPDGTRSAESGDIIAKLEAQHAIDARLTAEQIAAGRRLSEAVEVGLYFACLYSRVTLEEGWVHQRPVTLALVCGFLPRPVAVMALPVLRWQQVRKARKYGFDDPARGYQRAVDLVAEVSATLGEQDYLFGSTPSVADCSIWANLLHTGATLNANPPREAMRQDPRLVRYVERLAARAKLNLPATWCTS